jgi:co-chaperonin GroES (HSP10)
MRAIGRYVVVSTIAEDVTTAGLMLSGRDKEEMRYRRAVVVSPGTDVTSVQPGETIHYDTRSSFASIIEGETYTIIRDGDIIMVE